MKLIINTDSAAAKAITAMIHSAGTSETYINTLSRLYNCVLHNQDDLGMDDTEAIDTLRCLDLLRSDIRDIATDKDLKTAFRNLKDVEADLIDEHAGREKALTKESAENLAEEYAKCNFTADTEHLVNDPWPDAREIYKRVYYDGMMKVITILR